MLLPVLGDILALMVLVSCGKKKEKKSASEKPEVAPVSQNSITSTIATPTKTTSTELTPTKRTPAKAANIFTQKQKCGRCHYGRRARKHKSNNKTFDELFRSASYTKMADIHKKKEEKKVKEGEKEEEQLLKETSAVEPVEPKEIGLTKKEEMIKDGKLEPKKKNEYPTFQDIASDWDSEKEKEQKKKDEEKKAQEKKEEKIPPSSAKPKEMALTKKEEMIKEGKIQPKKKNEYPTFQDIASDWDSEKEKEQKKKEEKMKEMDSNQKKEQATAIEPDPKSEQT